MKVAFCDNGSLCWQLKDEIASVKFSRVTTIKVNTVIAEMVAYKRSFQITHEGGPEHNISFRIPRSGTLDSTIYVWGSNMMDPRYDVCLDWDLRGECMTDSVVKVGWQWNHLAMVYSERAGEYD